MATTKLQRHLFRLGAALAPLFLTLPSYSTVIDNFDSAAGWTTAADAAGSTISISTVTGETSGQALQLNYSLAVGNYAGVYKNTFGSLDLGALGANALQFSYRAASLANTVQIQLSDSDFPDPGKSTKKVYKFKATADNAWHTLTVPLADFDTWKDTGLGGDTNSAVFDASALAYLSYGVTKDNGVLGSDTIEFGGFALYRLDGPIPLVNSYETFAANCWVANTCQNERPSPQPSIAFPIEHPEWGSSMIVSTQAAPGSGSHSRELRYTIPVGGGFYGVSELLENVPVVGSDRIEFYTKGAAGQEPLKVQIKSQGMVCYADGHSACPSVALSTSAITTGWTKQTLLFSQFLSLPGAYNPDLSAISEIIFLFETANKSGRIYIDDVNIVRPSPNSGVVKVLEDFSGNINELGYGVYPSYDAQMEFSFLKDNIFSSSQGIGKVDYTFDASTSTPFAVVERPLGVNFLTEPMVRFRFKGTGANSDIEVKLKDTDGTVFRKVLADSSNTNGVWKTASIPVDQFSFFVQGGDANLNLTRVSQIEFILSRGEANSGTFTVDSLESFSPAALSKTNVGHLLTNVVIPNNPISPNHDGTKDIFYVDFNLSEAANVGFKVFNLQGVPVYALSPRACPSGHIELAWTGFGDNGQLLPNGIYFFVMEAEGTYSGKDTFRHVVAVMR